MFKDSTEQTPPLTGHHCHQGEIPIPGLPSPENPTTGTKSEARPKRQPTPKSQASCVSSFSSSGSRSSHATDSANSMFFFPKASFPRITTNQSPPKDLREKHTTSAQRHRQSAARRQNTGREFDSRTQHIFRAGPAK